MADKSSELTPEQRAAVVAGAELGILFSAGIGAGLGALFSSSGHRARGAFVGASVSVLFPLVLHSLATARVSEVVSA